MSELKLYELPECPVETTALLIGDRWKILIMRELLQGTKRFSEIRQSLSGISNKVLSQHLKNMEQRGLIKKDILNSGGVKTEYTLTEIGWELEAVITEMWVFGEKYKSSN